MMFFSHSCSINHSILFYVWIQDDTSGHSISLKNITSISIRLEAISIELEAISIKLEAIASRLEAIACRLEAIPINLSRH